MACRFYEKGCSYGKFVREMEEKFSEAHNNPKVLFENVAGEKAKKFLDDFCDGIPENCSHYKVKVQQEEIEALQKSTSQRR